MLIYFDCPVCSLPSKLPNCVSQAVFAAWSSLCSAYFETLSRKQKVHSSCGEEEVSTREQRNLSHVFLVFPSCRMQSCVLTRIFQGMRRHCGIDWSCIKKTLKHSEPVLESLGVCLVSERQVLMVQYSLRLWLESWLNEPSKKKIFLRESKW